MTIEEVSAQVRDLVGDEPELWRRFQKFLPSLY
jgi:histone deacetylase complex regulatory component SIN3